MAYRLLGDYYAKIPNDSVSDITLARQYYLKAVITRVLADEKRWGS